ncbi:oleoyl-acyl carrier protein thioesterase 1 [Citrus sinensis]|nr:oleoyl-acyl carrier protein thioesterase 1 [Citrus sinensis]
MLKPFCNVTDQAQCRFLGLPSPVPRFRRRYAVVPCSRPMNKPTAPVQVQAIVSDQGSPARLESGPCSLADRLRLGTLTEDGLSYKEKFIVRCYEVGINKTATVETIANLLQEVGCNHAQSVGFSTDGFATTTTMRKLHLIWVTARMHIEIYKYPAWSDVVEIETWCQSEGRIGTRRDWILKDHATGEVIGRATRLAFPEENSSSSRKISKLEDPAQYSRLGLIPRRADLDMNQHVNNVTYIGWLLESMPQDVIDTHELQTITLDYRRECQQDDVVDSLTSAEPFEDAEPVSKLQGTNGSPAITGDKEDNHQFLHLLRLSGDGSEINRGRSVWRKKPAR